MNEPKPTANEPKPTANAFGEKEGSKCCGCCCDMRRAVVVANIIAIIFAAIGGGLNLVGSELLSRWADSGDDLSEYEDALRTWGIVALVQIPVSIFAILGAATYNIWPIVLAILWFIGSFIGNVFITLDANDKFEEANTGVEIDFTSYIPSFAVSAIVTALFIYPHAGFISEVNQGIMTEETYPREQFSCCCS